MCDVVRQSHHLCANLVMRGEVNRERLFIADRLRLTFGDYVTVVASMCEVVEVTSMCDADDPLQHVEVDGSQVADCVNADAEQLLQRRWPDAPHCFDRQRQDEVEFLSRLDAQHAETVAHTIAIRDRLGGLRGQLRDEFARRNADAARKPDFRADTRTNRLGDHLRLTE